jgi:hypothetical protein
VYECAERRYSQLHAGWPFIAALAVFGIMR